MNCPDCGHTNPLWRSRCEKCDSPLPGALANQLREEEADWEAKTEEEEKPKRKSKLNLNVEARCPSCGYFGKPTYRGTCASCDSWIDPEKYAQSTAYRYRQEAPGCLKLYAVLLGIGAFLIGLGALANARYNGFFSIILFGIAIAQAFAAVGLYDMKRWARNLAIVVLGISLINNLLAFNPMAFLGMVFRGYVLFWLLTNGHLFSD